MSARTRTIAMRKEPPNSVLVVEDDDAHRSLLLTLLRSAGLNGLGASSAESALQILEHPDQEIDVVLCDLVLGAWPGAGAASGVDLLREWKRRRPATPFIFVTGVVDIAQVVEAVKLGAEDYITKPYVATELLQRVKECLEASHSATSLPGFDGEGSEVSEQ